MAAIAVPVVPRQGPPRVPPARGLRLVPPPRVGRPRRVSPQVRRRRTLAVALAALLALGAVWALSGGVGRLGSGPLAAPGSDPSLAVPAAAEVHIVQPGDTVWSIARQLQPTGEIRSLVDRLVAEEHGRPLQVGDRIVLP